MAGEPAENKGFHHVSSNKSPGNDGDGNLTD
jgi:hypothetical protein